MATREENLKKINDELEQLSDEELDAVAGGIGGYMRAPEPNPEGMYIEPQHVDPRHPKGGYLPPIKEPGIIIPPGRPELINPPLIKKYGID